MYLLFVVSILFLLLLIKTTSSNLQAFINTTSFKLNILSNNLSDTNNLEIAILSKSKMKLLNIQLVKKEKLPQSFTQQSYQLMHKNKSLVTLDITKDDIDSDNCINIAWNKVNNYHPNVLIEDCILLSPFHSSNTSYNPVYWYGGAEQFHSHYAFTSHQGQFIQNQPFISSDIIASENKLGGVLQATWLNSQGWSVSMKTSVANQPLFLSINDNITTYQYLDSKLGYLCLRSEYADYYSKYLTQNQINNRIVQMEYKVCYDHNILKSWKNQIIRNIPYRAESPDIISIKNPIWSTWAEYKVNINQSAVLDYARRIKNNNFSYSVLEIDDRWSTTYGDFLFDPIKFPSPIDMISELHELGFKVMLWITPFCDRNATIYQYGIDQHYWVLNKTTIQPNPSTTNPNKRDSSSSSPYLIKWWENNITGSAVLDVTNPLAVSWFTERLKQLKDTYQIDGFKLDAGETIYIPPITDPNAYYYNNSVFLNKTQPLIYTQLYASIAQDLGEFSEVRAAWQTQMNRNYVRIMDLDSVWGSKNGISSIIPRLLLFSTLGYRYALPDMIGGNGYGTRGDLLTLGAPTAELYIRWIQMHLLLPMQFSIPPWRYERDSLYITIMNVVKDIFKLRKQLITYLEDAVYLAKDLGIPLVRPMWYEMPTLTQAALNIEDQFMIGDRILMAPIVKKSVTERQVLLPTGTWILCSKAISHHKNHTITRGQISYMNNNNNNNTWSWIELLNSVYHTKFYGPITINLTDIYLAALPPCFLRLLVN